MSVLWHVSDIDWFDELTEDEMRQVESSVHAQRYDVGQTIFSPTSEPRSVFLLKEGTARIYRVSSDGAEATFGYVRPGEVFGELAAVTGLSRESYAEAASPAIVWRIPIELFRRLLGSRPGVGKTVASQMGQRLKRIERRVEGLMFHDASSRLAIVLKELGDHFGLERGGAIEIDGEFTQSELATLVGCTRQTLNQCLRDFDGKGMVEMKRRRIRILDPKLLREHVGRSAH